MGAYEYSATTLQPTIVEWPTATPITYGQTLASSSLLGGLAASSAEQLGSAASLYGPVIIDGTFSFDRPLLHRPDAGVYRATVNFTAANTTDYTAVTGGTVDVIVNKATPAIVYMPVPSELVYGQTLASCVLTGGQASVPGVFAFDAPDSAPGAGTVSAPISFIPTDSANNSTVPAGALMVTVNKATPVVTVWPVAGVLASGDPLSNCALTGGAASVPGVFGWASPETTPDAGTFQAPVTFTPDDSLNYFSVSGNVNVTVIKMAIVPDVAGLAQLPARTLIAKEGLVLGAVTLSYHATVPLDCVIFQDPIAGTVVMPASPVNLTLSRGPEPTPLKPATPSDLRVTTGADRAVLFWSANAEANLAGYNVYRAAGSDGPFVKINQELVTLTRYEDQTGAGQSYCYQVTAVNGDGVESDPAGPVCSDGSLALWLKNISAQEGEEVRIPLNISNANGIVPNGLDIDFRYDPALLDASSIRVERTIVTASVNFLVNATEAGRVRISGVGDHKLVGEGHLFDIYAMVNPDLSSDECGTTSYALAKFYDATPELIPCNYNDTGELCAAGLCREGDLNSDASVNSADVILALKMATRLVIPQGCQADAGDINGDGRIDSADAIMIQRLAVGLPLNPSQPGGKSAAENSTEKACMAKTGSAKQVAIGAGEGVPGGTVEIPVTLNDAEGVSGIELTISYPWTDGGISLDQAQAGSLTGDFLRQFNKGNGSARFSLSHAQALTGGSGTVAVLQFSIPASVSPGDIPVRLNAAELKGQYGDSFSWYSDVAVSDGVISVKASAFTVTLLECTGGSITLNPAQPAGGYEAGASVSVTAVPEADFSFTAWSGDLSGAANPAVVVVNAPKSIGALFTQNVAPPASIEDAAGQLLDVFDAADANHDGVLSETEARTALPGLTTGQFAQLDENNDGQLSRDELNRFFDATGCACNTSKYTMYFLKKKLADLFILVLAGLLLTRVKQL